MELNEMQVLSIIKELLNKLSVNEVERIVAWLEVYIEHRLEDDIDAE